RGDDRPNRDRCASYRLLFYVPSRTTSYFSSPDFLAGAFLAAGFFAAVSFAGFAAAASFLAAGFAAAFFGASLASTVFGAALAGAFAFGSAFGASAAFGASSTFGAASFFGAAFFSALPSPTETMRSSVICWRCPALRR